MNSQLKKSLDDFLFRAKSTGRIGKIIDLETLSNLNDRLNNHLPLWFIELLSSYPIVGIDLEFLFEDSDEDDSTTILIADMDDIYCETVDCYPGIAIKELGYFCFGTDSSGGGNPFFIQNNRGDNPPVYQVYHDVSDEGLIIENEGMEKIADSLSDFFYNVRIAE